jgi:23S rRNA pseudouridine2605 synthase
MKDFPLASPPSERLSVVLARAGYGSRRSCDELIAAHRVRVNGKLAVVGCKVNPEVDEIEVDGIPVPARPDLVYYLLNKPRGVISTAKDTHGRPTVVSFVPKTPRVFPVGRLDVDTEGLILLTNDGEFSYLITHPSHGIEKEYLVEVVREPSKAALSRLRRGVQLDDGWTAPAKVSHLAERLLRISIREGRKREVRRMCDAVGCPVARLVRTRIGPLHDRSLRPGQWRRLTVQEVVKLRAAAKLKPS